MGCLLSPVPCDLSLASHLTGCNESRTTQWTSFLWPGHFLTEKCQANQQVLPRKTRGNHINSVKNHPRLYRVRLFTSMEMWDIDHWFMRIPGRACEVMDFWDSTVSKSQVEPETLHF